VLEVDGLAKRYGEVLAISELSLSVAAGTALVLLGQNGAGKTTALRCISGLLKPSAGRVLVGGIDSLVDPDAVRAQVGLVPEVPGLYERMSARAYLDYFGRVYELDSATRTARIGDLLDLFGLSDAADRWLGTFSKGMRQKVALIRATIHRPRLVLADEPTSALDPDTRPGRLGLPREPPRRRRGAGCLHPQHGGGAGAGRPDRDHGPRQVARLRRPPRADPGRRPQEAPPRRRATDPGGGLPRHRGQPGRG